MSFALIIVEEFAVKDSIQRALQDLHVPSAEIACAHVNNQGNICLGYVCFVRDPAKQEQFQQKLAQTLKSLEKKGLLI